jgi:hypothetical protein
MHGHPELENGSYVTQCHHHVAFVLSAILLFGCAMGLMLRYHFYGAPFVSFNFVFLFFLTGELKFNIEFINSICYGM